LEKKVRVEIGIIGSVVGFTVGIMLYTLGGTESSMALALSLAGGLGFFLGWWVVSSSIPCHRSTREKAKVTGNAIRP
jgi:peptidoglycan biosynthesis protein MviN/MurJ (putative lipid II flippase)